MLARDAAGAWVWRDSPPPLRQVFTGRTHTPGPLPAGSIPLRRGWVVWNVAVAVPTTAVLYVLAWLLQHPARTLIAGMVAGPLTILWIK